MKEESKIEYKRRENEAKKYEPNRMARRHILAVWFVWKAASSSILFVRHRVSSAFQAELPIGIGSYIGEKKEKKSRLCVVPPKNPKSFYGGKSRREDEIGRKVRFL